MPKLKDLLKKYKENDKAIKETKQDTMKDSINILLVRERQQNLVYNIVSEIEKKYGSEVAKNVVLKLYEKYDKSKEKAKDFNLEKDTNDFKNKFETILFRKVGFQAVAENNSMPLAKEIKEFARSVKVTNYDSLYKYGLKKFYDDTKKVIPNLEEIASQGITVLSSANRGYILEGLDETIAELPEIDLDIEINEVPYPLDLTAEELSSNQYKRVTEDLKKVDSVKNNAERIKQLDEINILASGTHSKFHTNFTDYRDRNESNASKRNKDYSNYEYEKAEKKYIDETVCNHSPVQVAKKGFEKEALELGNNIEFVLGDKTKEGLKLVINKLSELNLSENVGEEDAKIYALSNLMKHVGNIHKLLNSITINPQMIQLKQMQIDAEKDQAKKQALEAEKRQLEEENQKNIEELFKEKTLYDKAEKQVDGLIEIINQYFPNQKGMPTNIDAARNDAIPLKYRMDLYNVSYLNGIYYIYALLKQNNISVDDFLKNPGKVAYDNYKKQLLAKELTVDDTKKTFEEDFRSISPIIDASDLGRGFTLTFTNEMRALETLACLDNDHIVENTKSYNNIHSRMAHLSAANITSRKLDKNAEKTYENIFATKGIKIKDLLMDDYYDPLNYKIVPANEFDVNDYINQNEIDPEEMVSRFNTVVKTIVNTNLGKDEKNNEHLKSSMTDRLTNAYKGFSKAAIKYMQKYKIDPEKTNDPNIKFMKDIIEDPQKYIADNYYKYCESIDNEKELNLLNRLKVSKKTDERAKIEQELALKETKAINDEKAFDKSIKNARMLLNDAINSIEADNPESYDYVEEYEKYYHDKLNAHINDLKEKLDQGLITEGFYLNRIEQVMAGEPIGKLGFFNNKLTIAEQEYIDTKLEENENLPKDKQIDRATAQKMYYKYKEYIENEKEHIISDTLRENDVPFEDIDIKYENYMDYETVNSYKPVEPIISYINATANNDEVDNIINDVFNQSFNLEDLEESNQKVEAKEEPKNAPSRTQIHIDLGEKPNVNKSNFVKNGDNLEANLNKNVNQK
ncbi:MAG: hypothetical protein K6A63_00965 [Acholeplasmatales bacterium]|nr:hypothetical protein [Acholeplasmatales bacterium]